MSEGPWGVSIRITLCGDGLSMVLRSGNGTFRAGLVWLIALALQPWCCCVGPAAAHAEMGGGGMAPHGGVLGGEGSAHAHRTAASGHDAGGCGAQAGKGTAAESCRSPKDGVQRDCGNCECDIQAMALRGSGERSATALALSGAGTALPGWITPVAGLGDQFSRDLVSVVCNRVLPERCSDRSLLGQGTLLTT